MYNGKTSQVFKTCEVCLLVFMNIAIPADDYRIWERLTLSVPEPLDFRLHQQYLFVGDNGAGKSSFVKRVFLPAFEAQADHRLLLFYITQDFLMQFYAIKAHSAFHQREKSAIHSPEEAIAYMYACHRRALQEDTALAAVFDESEAVVRLRPLIEEIATLRSMILVITHQQELMDALPNAHRLEFRRLDLQRSEARLR